MPGIPFEEPRQLVVLKSESNDPEENLPVDDILFDSVDRGKIMGALHIWVNRECLVRGQVRSEKYGWYREEVARELGVPVYRRSTGGGVVYHDLGNLNWSLLFRVRGGLMSPPKMFREASDWVVTALEKVGVHATFAPPNRIDVEGRKVSGMAARSGSRALLVHGTLLVRTDLDRLNQLCIPPPLCPPVANISEWNEKISFDHITAALESALAEDGFQLAFHSRPPQI